MSVSLFAGAWKIDLPATEKLLLLALCDHANDEDRTCFPSVTHLSKKTSLHRSSVFRLLDILKDKGIVSIVGARKQTNVYRINFDPSYYETSRKQRPVAACDQSGDQVNPNQSQPVTSRNTRPVAEQDFTDRTVRPDPSHSEIPLVAQCDTEPSMNHQEPSQNHQCALKPETYLSKKRKKLSGWMLEAFNQFWQTYDYKNGKAEAADAWLELDWPDQKSCKNSMFQKILNAAAHECKRRPGLRASGLTPKMAQGWLASRRYDDEYYLEDNKHEQNSKTGSRLSAFERACRANSVDGPASETATDITAIVERLRY